MAARTLIILIVITSILTLPGSVIAQPAAPTPDANTTGPSTDAQPQNGGSGDGDGGIVPNFPSGWEMFKNILNKSTQDIANGTEMIASGIHGFNEVTLTVPAPGERDDPSTWVETPASDSWWYGVFLIHWTLSPIAFLLIAAFGAYAATNETHPGKRRQHIRNTGFALAGVLLLLPLLALALHITNVFAVGIAPSGEEFLSTTGNFAKLGIGVILGVALLLFKSVLVLIGILVLLAQWFVALFLVAIFPLLIAARVSPFGNLQAIGRVGISAFVFLLVLKIGQALLLRFLFHLPLGGDALTSVIVLLIEILGVGMAFVALPVWGTKKLVPSAIVSTSTGHGGSIAGTVKERGPGRAQIQERITTIRGGDGGDRGRSGPKRTAGGSGRANRDTSSTARSARESARKGTRSTRRKRKD